MAAIEVNMTPVKLSVVASVNGSSCPGISCQHPGSGSLLGVGCSDPYGSGLNGDQDGAGGTGHMDTDRLVRRHGYRHAFFARR